MDINGRYRELASVEDEGVFLEVLLGLKSTGESFSATSVPRWLAQWTHPVFPELGGNILHVCVCRGFAHVLRELLNAAREYAVFLDDQRQRRQRLKMEPVADTPWSLRAFVDAEDVYGRVPLHFALLRRDSTMVRLLLAHSASAWIPDPVCGLTTVQLAERIVKDFGELAVGEEDMTQELSGPAVVQLSMIESLPQIIPKTPCPGASGVPAGWGLNGSPIFLWEKAEVIAATQKGDYRTAALECRHRGARSALLTTLASVVKKERKDSSTEGGDLRVDVLVTRWLLAALCADAWNNAAASLLYDTLRDSADPFGIELATELHKAFFLNPTSLRAGPRPMLGLPHDRQSSTRKQDAVPLIRPIEPPPSLKVRVSFSSGNTASDDPCALWVSLPSLDGETPLVATHGILQRDLACGFPFEAGDLITFKVDNNAQRTLRFESVVQAAQVSLPVGHAAPRVQQYVQLWGVPCITQLDRIAEFEWPIVTLSQLGEQQYRASWCNLLHCRYGEKLWVAVEEDVFDTDGVIGRGRLHWAPQYAQNDVLRVGCRILYNRASLKFLDVDV